MDNKQINSDRDTDNMIGMSAANYQEQDLDQFLDFIIEKAVKIMHARAGSLLLLDQKTQRLYFKVTTGEKKEEVKKFEIKVGEGIAGQVAKTGESLLVQNVKQDSRWSTKISDSTGFQTNSIVCSPMKVGSEIIGVVEIIDKADGSSFQESDVTALTELSEMAAMAIGNARKIEQAKREDRNLQEDLGEKYQIIGKSRAIKKVTEEAFKVAKSKTSALILGESGTGKELLARLIHKAGPRRDKTMVVLNCAALPETLLEDELFGHEKGAYTGASERKIGKFEVADGGTIFLDEIGEMHPGMQAKLLRILQEGIFYRIGGNTSISVDVRVISATNRDITKEVEEGRFREDLYYRLNVVQIKMPPLRERKEDIPLLSEYFIDYFKEERGLATLSISEVATNKLVQYDWPGNIRELGNAIERAVVMGDSREIKPEDLPAFSSKVKNSGMQVGLTLNDALNSFKKDFILLNLNNTGGNRSKAAKIMDIQRTYLSRLISRYQIHDI